MLSCRFSAERGLFVRSAYNRVWPRETINCSLSYFRLFQPHCEKRMIIWLCDLFAVDQTDQRLKGVL